jgi:DCC1-like thiol-disulfide oxidoreductase
VVYDGYCPLCIRTATQLDALDGAKRLRYVDLEREWARAAELVPGVSQEDMRAEMAEVTPEGGVSRILSVSRDQQAAARAVGAAACVVCAGSGVGGNAGVCAGGGKQGAATVRRGVLRGARGARGGGGKRECGGD